MEERGGYEDVLYMRKKRKGDKERQEEEESKEQRRGSQRTVTLQTYGRTEERGGEG